MASKFDFMRSKKLRAKHPLLFVNKSKSSSMTSRLKSILMRRKRMIHRKVAREGSRYMNSTKMMMNLISRLLRRPNLTSSLPWKKYSMVKCPKRYFWPFRALPKQWDKKMLMKSNWSRMQPRERKPNKKHKRRKNKLERLSNRFSMMRKRKRQNLRSSRKH